MLRTLTRPSAEFTRILPSMKSNHTGVFCGEPSGITVARCASALFSCSKSM
jgi:hypothetical protein